MIGARFDSTILPQIDATHCPENFDTGTKYSGTAWSGGNGAGGMWQGKSSARPASAVFGSAFPRGSSRHPEDRHLQVNTFQPGHPPLHDERFQQFLDAWKIMDFLAQKNLFGFRQTLHPCRDIHRLTKIVEPVVRGHGDRRTLMQTDFQD